MSNPLRVLHIVPSTMRAGVEMTVMNLYRNIDRERLQFDFIAHEQGEDNLGGEIEKLGGRIFRVPFLREAGVLKFVKIVRDIIEKNGPYAAVHAHTEHQGGFIALAAKKAGVPVRVCHAHMDTRTLRSPAAFVKRMLGRIIIGRYATQRCACSTNAAVAMYGRRAVRKGRVVIIRNSIDLSAFMSSPPRAREKLLKECGAGEQTRLIGYIGRLSSEKNPGFILDMAVEAKKRGLNYTFVLAGAGNLLGELQSKAEALELKSAVRFLGTRTDVPFLMQCFDILVVPSVSEGFSLVAAESQAAGTPVLAASCLPQEADMGLGIFHKLNLGAGAGGWIEQAEAIINSCERPDERTRMNAIKEKGFDIDSNVNTLMKLYGPDRIF